MKIFPWKSKKEKEEAINRELDERWLREVTLDKQRVELCDRARHVCLLTEKLLPHVFETLCRDHNKTTYEEQIQREQKVLEVSSRLAANLVNYKLEMMKQAKEKEL